MVLDNKQRMKFHSISNLQIDNWIREHGLLKDYGGCVSSDFFENATPERKFYVYNLQNSHDSSGNPLPGSHWLLLDASNKKFIFEVDGFGLPPNQSVVKWSKRGANKKKIFLYSDLDLQPVKGSQCAFFCLYLAFQVHKLGRNYFDVLYQDFQFEDEIVRFNSKSQKHNVAVLKQFFTAHPIK